MERKIDKRIIALIFLISSALVLLFVSYNSFLYPMQDESDTNVFITSARLMSDGKFPYKDFFDHKGPVLYMLFYIFYNLIPNTCHGIYIMEIIFAYFYMHFTYKSVSLINNKSEKVNILMTIIGCAISYSIEGQTHIEALCLPFSAYMIYQLIRYIKTKEPINNKSLFFIGIHIGLIFWMKYFVLMFEGILIICYIIFSLREKQYKNIKNLILYCFLGFLAVTGIVFIYCIVTDTLSDMIRVYFYMNIFEYPKIVTSKIFSYVSIYISTLIDIPVWVMEVIDVFYIFTYSLPIIYMIIFMLIRKDIKNNDKTRNQIFLTIAGSYLLCNIITGLIISKWCYYFINYSSVCGIILILFVTPKNWEKWGKHRISPKVYMVLMTCLAIILLTHKAHIKQYFYNYKVQQEITDIIKDDENYKDSKICCYNFINYGTNLLLDMKPQDYHIFCDWNNDYKTNIINGKYDYVLMTDGFVQKAKNIFDVEQYGYKEIYGHDIELMHSEASVYIRLYKKE